MTMFDPLLFLPPLLGPSSVLQACVETFENVNNGSVKVLANGMS